MPKKNAFQSHRFVVVYRSEEREIEGVGEIWRGWVERVPDPRQRDLEGQLDERLSFTELSELPERVGTLITQAGRRSQQYPAKKRRSLP